MLPNDWTSGGGRNKDLDAILKRETPKQTRDAVHECVRLWRLMMEMMFSDDNSRCTVQYVAVVVVEVVTAKGVLSFRPAKSGE